MEQNLIRSMMMIHTSDGMCWESIVRASGSGQTYDNVCPSKDEKEKVLTSLFSFVALVFDVIFKNATDILKQRVKHSSRCVGPLFYFV